MNVLNTNKSNVLHSTCELEQTKWLVSVGVDYKAINDDMETPLDYAIHMKWPNVAFLNEVQSK